MKITLAYLPEHRAVCVRHEDREHDKPALTVWWWKIREIPDHDRELYAFGAELTQAFGAATGQYRYRDPRAAGFPFGSGPLFELPEGGRTEAIKIESIPIPCPKVRKGVETRWHYGVWQKYLKSEGWVTA